MSIKRFKGPNKRGDLSPCGKKRFWQYGPSYKNGERWVPADKFEALREKEHFAKKMATLAD